MLWYLSEVSIFHSLISAGALTDSSDEERPRRSFSDTRHNASDDWRGRAIDEDRDEARRRFRDDYGRTRYDGLYRSSDDEGM